MTWVPIFEVSSKDFEEDVALLKEIFGGYERQIRFQDGYRLSSEAQFGMGWWFYSIYVKIGFIKGLVRHHHSINPKIRDEQDILRMTQERMASRKSTARLKIHGKKPAFARYWSWLMR